VGVAVGGPPPPPPPQLALASYLVDTVGQLSGRAR
jgi:hypothetical protein